MEISEVPGHVGAPPWSAHRGIGSRGRGDGGNTVGGGTGATIVARRCVIVGRERRCSSRRGLGKRHVREASFAQGGGVRSAGGGGNRSAAGNAGRFLGSQPSPEETPGALSLVLEPARP